MTGTPSRLENIDELAARLLARDPARRTVVAIAGAPGSGKSTIAARLVDLLNSSASGRAVLVPMDGFHYDDALLKELGRLKRKGAPDTFDVGGLRALLARLRARDEEAVAIPVFDRQIEISRGSARLVPQTADIVVVEGNYLLMSGEPWGTLAPFFDLRVMIDVPETVLRERLTDRWKGYGLTPDEIRSKLDDNDLPNGRLIVAESSGFDHILPN